MTFLVDAQLPFRLCEWFQQRGHTAMHSSTLTGSRLTPDESLWRLVQRDGWVVVSKDKDFRLIAARLGAPPQLRYRAVGNCGKAALAEYLEAQWPDIEDRLLRNALAVIVYRHRVAVAWA